MAPAAIRGYGEAVKLVVISDTHGHHEELELPDGDVIIHCGDFSRWGTDLDEARTFLAWFAALPFAHRVLVAGNHDMMFERENAAARALVPEGVTYLQDSGAAVGGLRLWGSPWTPRFFRWAFMLPRGEPLRARWDLIPAGTDVLITHGPPYGHGDQARAFDGGAPRSVGCLELLAAVRRVRPRAHLFGHIHEGYGVTRSDEVDGTSFMNAASCAHRDGLNPPLTLELSPGPATA
jgi:predicted phosphohydrolase